MGLISKLFGRKTKPLRWYAKSRESFRDLPTNIVWAQQRLNLDPRGQALQAYLMEGLIEPNFYPGDHLTLDQAAMEFSRMRGYLDCLKRLQEAAIPTPKSEEQIPADYDQTAPEDIETETES